MGDCFHLHCQAGDWNRVGCSVFMGCSRTLIWQWSPTLSGLWWLSHQCTYTLGLCVGLPSERQAYHDQVLMQCILSAVQPAACQRCSWASCRLQSRVCVRRVYVWGGSRGGRERERMLEWDKDIFTHLFILNVASWAHVLKNLFSFFMLYLLMKNER